LPIHVGGVLVQFCDAVALFLSVYNTQSSNVPSLRQKLIFQMWPISELRRASAKRMSRPPLSHWQYPVLFRF